MRILTCILFIFIFSCGSKKGNEAAELLPPEKMRDVLISLHISEALINMNNSLKAEEKKELNFNVYKENGVSREQYLKSLDYYSQNPEELKKIYALAMEKLNVMKDQKP